MKSRVIVSLLIVGLIAQLCLMASSLRWAAALTASATANPTESETASSPGDQLRDKLYAYLLTGRKTHGKLDELLDDYLSNGILPSGSDELRHFGDHVSVIIFADGDIEEIEKHVRVRCTAKLGRTNVIFGFVSSPEELRALVDLPDVLYIMADKVIKFKEPSLIMSRSHQASDGTGILDQWKVREITGVDKVEEELDIWGEGAVISIVDTGVDFGLIDLRNAIDRDDEGFITSFDPSGTGIALTYHVFEKDAYGMLPISGCDLDVWFWGLSYKYSDLREIFTDLPELQDLYVGGVESKSGKYHVGVMVEYGYSFSIDPKLGCFLCVVVDSEEAGVYDTVYVDLDWDFSIADEEPHRWGDPIGNSEVLARDLNNDGYPDVSAGCLCRVFDYFEIANGGIIEGIDPSGNYVGFMYDYYGHGTPCAVCAAGRGLLGYDVYENGTLYTLPGIARRATLQAIKMLTLSDVMMGWMWSCGFDLNEEGQWIYTGNHKADVISNSWGMSEFEQIGGFATGWDMVSLTIDELSPPGFIDASYPGTLFVVAGGNGGSGYGTATTPSTSSSALCVGASTSFHVFETSYGPDQKYDEVVYWSARGPSPVGAPEPDVLNVGWIAFSQYPIWAGNWSGTQIFGGFGGTSMATPLTSGVCALVISALKSRGVDPGPDVIKCLIESTADDLGYDPLTQGAGRVNAYKAVSAALGIDEANGWPLIIVRSNATALNVGQIVNDAFFFWFKTNHPALTSPMLDSNVFLGRTLPGGHLSWVIQAETPSGYPVDNAYATRYTLLDKAIVALPKTEDIYNTYVLAEFLEEDFMDEFYSCDLAVIFLSYDVKLFRKLALVAENPSYVFLHDWRDLNLNGEIDYNGTGEVRRVADCFRWSNVLGLYVGWPGRDFHRYNADGVERGPTLMFHDTGFEEFEDWEGTDLLMVVLLFKEVSWGWVSAERDPIDSTLWRISVDVPGEACPGVYAGFLVFEKGGIKIRVPMTFSIAGIPPEGPSSISFGNSTGYAYDLGAVYGAYDWSWREESGDYRIYPFEISDPRARYGVFGVLWTLDGTMLDVWIIGPNGQVVEKSQIVHMGGGRFESKSTRDKGQVMVFEVKEPGIYTFVLHATAFNGAHNPENITLYAYYSTTELPEAIPIWSVANGSVLYGPHAVVSIKWNMTSVEELPDIQVWKTQISIMRGKFFRFEGSIDPAEDVLKSGWYENVGECEDYIYVWLEEGKKVYIEVGWVGPTTDIDVFCWAPGVEQTFDNSLLGDQTATLNNPEKGTFTAPVTGNYTIGIDWYGGPASELPVPYYVIVSTLRGFTLTRSGEEATMDTSVMGVNGTFILNSTLLTGTNIRYTSNITVTAYNFFPPSVEILYPRAGDVVNGTVLIRWNATDPNEDETLTFDLYVSFDNGTTWLELAYSLRTMSYEWDTRPSAWRGIEYCNTTMIKIVVSDGKVEREDVSGPFTVDNRPPQEIELPEEEKPPAQPPAWRIEYTIGIATGVGIASAGVAYVMLKRRRREGIPVPAS